MSQRFLYRDDNFEESQGRLGGGAIHGEVRRLAAWRGRRSGCWHGLTKPPYLHSTWRQVRGHSVTGAAVPRAVCRCRPRPPPASPSAQRAGYSLLCTAAPHLHTYCLHTVITD